jgi:hypothetical protein
MDRLTKKYAGGYGLAKVKDNEQALESPYPNTLRACFESWQRLGAYEDTGLTPDEIAALRAEIERLRAENAAFKADIEAGRLVRLPYPIGTNAYAAERDGPLSGHVMQIEVRGYSESDWHGSRNAGKDRCFVICHNSYNDPYAKQLQDVFPTEEAARAALEGGQQHV